MPGARIFGGGVSLGRSRARKFRGPRCCGLAVRAKSLPVRRDFVSAVVWDVAVQAFFAAVRRNCVWCGGVFRGAAGRERDARRSYAAVWGVP